MTIQCPYRKCKNIQKFETGKELAKHILSEHISKTNQPEPELFEWLKSLTNNNSLLEKELMELLRKNPKFISFEGIWKQEHPVGIIPRIKNPMKK